MPAAGQCLESLLESGTDGADPDVAGSDGRTAREIAGRKKDKRYSAALS